MRTFHEALEAVETYSPAEEQFNARRLTIDGDLTLSGGSKLRHSANYNAATHKLDVKVNGTLDVQATASIDGTGRGYAGGFRGSGFGPVAVTSRCGTQSSTCLKPSKRPSSSSTTSKKERR